MTTTRATRQCRRGDCNHGIQTHRAAHSAATIGTAHGTGHCAGPLLIGHGKPQPHVLLHGSHSRQLPFQTVLQTLVHELGVALEEYLVVLPLRQVVVPPPLATPLTTNLFLENVV